MIWALSGLYLKLAMGVGLGWLLGRFGKGIRNLGDFLGWFLFWVGVPMGAVVFLRGTEISGAIWSSVGVSAIAFLGGGLVAGLCLWLFPSRWAPITRGSFILASMFGNTGYIGYPVSLTLLGSKYFAWSLFYDFFGTTLGAYGLGTIIATYFSKSTATKPNFWLEVIKNPLWLGLVVGWFFRFLPLPPLVEVILQAIGWLFIALSLVLIGWRLSEINSWARVSLITLALGIKMMLIPLVVGLLLPSLGIMGTPRLALVLQMAMPPAFATLVIAEAYHLDRDLAVGAIALGCIFLLFTLPLWVSLFGV